MTLEEMEKLRKEKGFTYRQISEGSDVPLGTVQKIFGKTTSSPRYDTLQKLEGFFVSESGSWHARKVNRNYTPKIRRTDIDGQGHYTVEDYLDWPEDERIELIDGVIYDMAAPTSIHQLFQTESIMQVSHQIRKRGGGCVPIGAPTDVQLDCDKYTMVQPDFMIICDRSKINKERVFGVPDFIIEILSPSSRMKDTFIKQNKYMSSGVREYWTVDLRDQLVTTYLYEEGRVLQYSLEDTVPIGIYDGKIKVNFKEISDYVRDIFGDISEPDDGDGDEDERA